MRPCIYFSPKPQLDVFEGTRLRKNLKGALELHNIDYAKNLDDEFDLAHFIALNDESKIDDAIEMGSKIVFSALYTERDPSCKIFTGLKEHKELSNKALRVLNKCDLVLVPSEEDKKTLIDNDVISKIEVLTPGVNLSRFHKTGRDEDDVFFEYYQLEKGAKCIATIGTLNDQETIEKLFSIARQLPDYKFFYYGPGKHPWANLFSRHKIPHNVLLSGLTNDEIFCSMLKNLKCFLVLSDVNSSLMTLLEVMASKTEIIALDSITKNKEILIKEKRAHACASTTEIVDLILKLENGEVESYAEEAYKFAKKNSLKNLGQELINKYQTLLEGK